MLDVLGLAVPATGINTASKIGRSLQGGDDVVKTHNSGLSGGWANVLYPTLERKLATPPPPAVAPAEMDIPFAEPGRDTDFGTGTSLIAALSKTLGVVQELLHRPQQLLSPVPAELLWTMEQGAIRVLFQWEYPVRVYRPIPPVLFQWEQYPPLPVTVHYYYIPMIILPGTRINRSLCWRRSMTILGAWSARTGIPCVRTTC